MTSFLLLRSSAHMAMSRTVVDTVASGEGSPGSLKAKALGQFLKPSWLVSYQAAHLLLTPHRIS